MKNVGIYSAARPYSWFDRIASTLAFVGFSLPTFFTGLLLILLFSIKLDWLPFVFRADIARTGWQWWEQMIKQSIMPVMCWASSRARAGRATSARRCST